MNSNKLAINWQIRSSSTSAQGCFYAIEAIETEKFQKLHSQKAIIFSIF